MENIINVKNGKITVTPEARMSTEAFKAFRSEGWLYSGRMGCFVFDDTNSGAERVERLMNGKLTVPYGTEADRKESVAEELKEMTFAYASSAVEEHITTKIEQNHRKAETDAAEKKAKEKKADENRAKRYVSMVEKLGKLHNGFSASKYNMALCNYNMSELLQRDGVEKQLDIAEKSKEYGLPELADDNGVMIVKLGYDEVFEGSSYWNRKKIGVRLTMTVDYMEKRDGTWLAGGSGKFHFKVALGDTVARMNFSEVVEGSGRITETVLKAILQDYADYKSGKQEYTVSSIGDFLSNGFVNTAAAIA